MKHLKILLYGLIEILSMIGKSSIIMLAVVVNASYIYSNPIEGSIIVFALFIFIVYLAGTYIYNKEIEGQDEDIVYILAVSDGECIYTVYERTYKTDIAANHALKELIEDGTLTKQYKVYKIHILNKEKDKVLIEQ